MEVPPADTVSRSEFDSMYEALSQWRTWPDTGRGAFNRLGDREVVRAASLVRSGRTVTTALPWNTQAAVDNPRPALHHMVDMGDNEAPEPSTNKDFLAIDYHGKSVSHLDALSHIAYRGQLFSGQRSAAVVTTNGTTFGSVAALGPFVGRGVLIDLPHMQGRPWLEPGTPVRLRDVEEAERVQQVTLSNADALLIRTGHKARRDEVGPWDSGSLSAGLHTEVAGLLAERRVALLGSDGDSDLRPSPVPGVHSPIHVLAITAMGIPLLDNLDLEALSIACAEEGRWEFLFVVAPLNVPHGTGSPVNPIAVF